MRAARPTLLGVLVLAAGAALVWPHPARDAAATWTAPGARAGLSAAVLDGRVHVVGGSAPGSGGLEHDVFDVAAGRWQAAGPLPTPMVFGGAATVGGHLYAVGGLTRDVPFLPHVWRYDAASDEWSAPAPLPVGLNRLAVVAFVGRVLTVGGIAAGSGDTGAFLSYDPAADAWTELPPMPTPRHGHAAAVLDSVLYVSGGYRGEPLASVEAFDFRTGTWSSRAALRVPRGFHGLAAAGDRLYAFGGRVRDHRVATEAYDPGRDEWTSAAPIPEWRDRFAWVVLDGTIYLIGGETDFGSGVGDTVLIYDPVDDAWSELEL